MGAMMRRPHARVDVIACCAVAVVCLSTAVSTASDEVPNALVRAIEARSALRLQTAHVEWSIRWSDSESPDPPHTYFHSWRAAGDDYTSVFRGAEDGVVYRGADGRAAPFSDNGPVHYLVKNRAVWSHVENAVRAKVFDLHRRQSFHLFDMRTLGLNPVWFELDLNETLSANAERPKRYSQSIDGDLTAITLSFSPAEELRWWIDPARDWSVVRTAVLVDGVVTGETRYTIEEREGIWFPTRVEHFNRGGGDTEASTVVEVLYASFNQPQHPVVLDVADIGIEVGTTVEYMDQNPRTTGMWDGQKVVPPQELAARIANGELSPGPNRVREGNRLRELQKRREVLALREGGVGADAATSQPASAASDSAALVLREFETAWERYTREFVSRFHLDTEQEQKAWVICRECQARARGYVDAKRTEITAVLAELEQLEHPSAARSAKSRDASLRRRERLLAPIQRIFDNELCPRLDRLPTRAQREAQAPDALRPGSDGRP